MSFRPILIFPKHLYPGFAQDNLANFFPILNSSSLLLSQIYSSSVAHSSLRKFTQALKVDTWKSFFQLLFILHIQNLSIYLLMTHTIFCLLFILLTSPQSKPRSLLSQLLKWPANLVDLNPLSPILFLNSNQGALFKCKVDDLIKLFHWCSTTFMSKS